ncbi:hypothetical protein D3C86_473300 [compost metagenome]
MGAGLAIYPLEPFKRGEPLEVAGDVLRGWDDQGELGGRVLHIKGPMMPRFRGGET